MKEGWTYKKLGEVCDIYGRIGFRGYTTKDLVDSPEKGAISLSPSNILDGKMDYSKCTYISWFKYEESPEIKIFNGDILLVKTGSSYGKSALVENLPHEATINPQSVVLKNFRINSKFFAYQLRTNTIRKEFDKFVSGTAIPTFSQAKLSTVPIVFPPLDEQQRIVERLDSAFENIDKLKANAEKQLSEARILFQKSLAKAMEPKEGWEEKTLGEIAVDMYRGAGIKRDQVTEEGIPCVRYGEIYTTYNVGFNECVSHTKIEYLKSPKYFEHGDLLFAITGESVEDIGKTIAYLGKEECLLGGDIICMKHKQNPKYLAYALSTPDAIKQKGFGKTKLKVVHTNAPALKAIKIPLPPLPVQQRIVERLDSLSENVRKYEEIQRQMISECDALKQALLRKVFE